jgi:hypothetical protein
MRILFGVTAIATMLFAGTALAGQTEGLIKTWNCRIPTGTKTCLPKAGTGFGTKTCAKTRT